MKYFKLSFLLLLTVFMACSKDKSEPKSENISVLDGAVSALSQSDLATVNLLLNTNKITTTNFVPQQLSQYYRMEPSSVPFHNNFIPTYMVSGYTFFNKLPMLNGTSYGFDVTTNQLIYSAKPAYSTVNMDNVAKSSVSAVKAAFATITDTLRYPYRTPEHLFAGKHLEDSTLVATFGYYDLSYNYTAPNIIKAWKIGTKSGSMYIFIKDETNTFVARDY